MARVRQCHQRRATADLSDYTGNPVSQILLEAADPATLDTTYNVVKAKKGEESVVRVTTKDAQGNLVGNTAFILTRANSVSRANASATMAWAR